MARRTVIMAGAGVAVEVVPRVEASGTVEHWVVVVLTEAVVRGAVVPVAVLVVAAEEVVPAVLSWVIRQYYRVSPLHQAALAVVAVVAAVLITSRSPRLF